MPYDKSLDKELFRESAEFDGTRVVVSVFAYNGGQKKLQLGRETQNAEGDWRFAKLGRMQLDEVQAVQPLIIKAAEEMA